MVATRCESEQGQLVFVLSEPSIIIPSSSSSPLSLSMATPQALKMLELCRVSPPPGSVPETTLPLSFLDVFWLLLPPVQRLLFYELSEPNTTTHFINTLLPKLKHSLSLSLRLFFPLAGNLTQSPITGDHEIHYIDGNSVSLTIAESDANFHKLVSNHHRKEGTEFRPLVPQLQPPSLLALQVTIFPNTGISVGISIQHVVADGRSLAHFMKSWSSINRTGDDSLIVPHPFHERTMLEDRDGLKRLILNQMENAVLNHSSEASKVETLNPPTPTVRATFVLSRADIELLRCRVLHRVEQSHKPFHCSTFVLTCAYVWTCLIKTRVEAITDENDYFVFAVDCRSRLHPPLPATCFGNCIGMCFAEAKRSDLSSEHSIAAASEAIGRVIQGLDDGVLKGAENWIPRFINLVSQRALSVAGSPKFRVYDTDFGWGRPKKTEVTSIDTTGAMYIEIAEMKKVGLR